MGLNGEELRGFLFMAYCGCKILMTQDVLFGLEETGERRRIRS